MIVEELNTTITEMSINVDKGLPETVTNSIYYNRLKHLLFPEIVSFCKEKYELKSELQSLREHVGEKISEYEVREYLDKLKEKYNNKTETNIALDYHIEFTRIDMSVCVFVCIKRDEINMKKFIFRYRKSASDSLAGLTTNGMIDPDYDNSNSDERISFYTNLIANAKKEDK